MLENNPLLYNSYDSLQTPLTHPIIQNQRSLNPTPIAYLSVGENGNQTWNNIHDNRRNVLFDLQGM
jgi:hypothetical protein